MRRIVMLALTLPVFLVGCGGQETTTNNDDSPGQSLDTTNGIVERDGNTDIIVRKFTFDGTECIVTSMNGIALSCNWEASNGIE